MIKSLHILASMNYFDSNMSKSTNTVVYFDWKTVIYIYVSGKCCMQFIGDEGDLATGRLKLQLM
jgi:ArsR family metal-binding transcriptional regulator